nr:hypothetical protein [Lentibacillus sediminis]
MVNLEIKVAFSTDARRYMERMIAYLEQTNRKKLKKKKGIDHLQPKKTSINYHCLMCHEEEEIPYDVVRDFDLMEGGGSVNSTKI